MQSKDIIRWGLENKFNERFFSVKELKFGSIISTITIAKTSEIKVIIKDSLIN